ncbi:cytochrome-c oxidase [Cephaloticoccus primus]|uniref:Cytochrome-c oxidase n=1 Tax=Cephaloticoccus primus TaxID=1548207 RepID=A0A139SQ23_9BACT|nr:4Fe-4S dicluster domain-containing protein [Cephaloticoccus primus]KXU36666.1 cytochrome-c oxidase [Cephaloticoccus primus]
MARPARPTIDSVTTIGADGSRPFIYPADVKGRFATARKISAFFLIALYLALPWIQVGGFPAVFLDIAGRRFHLFGLTFAAQDVWLTFFLITGLGFSLFFITALFGRIWCGWACPQTVFLDHVYRRIERWVEGNAVARRKLAAAPWNAEKIARRSLKHALYLLVSLLITHLFLAYYVSLKELWTMMRSAPAEHWSAFVFVATATAGLYFNFAWFREQLCIVICPYGRLQSAMIDDHSMVVGYDAARGEPRGRAKAASANSSAPLRAATAGVGAGDAAQFVAEVSEAARTAGTVGGAGTAASGAVAAAADAAPRGDCVDCARCVQVCPTGIDIRQGLQLECIGCTACIDACDEVMRRVKRPTGLIRYDSQAALAGGRTRWLRPRVALYTTMLLIGVGVASWALSTVKPANVSVTRITGTPYVVTDAAVRNQFFVRVLNKRAEPASFTVEVEAPAPLTRNGLDAPLSVGPIAEEVRPLVLLVPRDHYSGPFKIKVHIRDTQGRFHSTREVEFLGPDPRLLEEEAE